MNDDDGVTDEEAASLREEAIMPGRREVAIFDRARLERESSELPLSPRADRVPTVEDVSAGPVGCGADESCLFGFCWAPDLFHLFSIRIFELPYFPAKYLTSLALPTGGSGYLQNYR
jgi:hypothetical protein